MRHAAHRIDALKPGRHTLAVKVTDLTGNTRTNSYSWTVDNSQIAFPSDRDGNSDIYVIDTDEPPTAPNNEFRSRRRRGLVAQYVGKSSS